MSGKHEKKSRREKSSPGARPSGNHMRSMVDIAIHRGFLIGREVLVGNIRGVVLGYNIGSFGRFVGSAYPLIVYTRLGATKCSMDEVRLA